MTDLRRKKSYEQITDHLDNMDVDTSAIPELKNVEDNLQFEQDIVEHPIPEGVGSVDVFGTTYDIHAILKGNYWGRSIYTTDKICKMFLKWNIERQKKYLLKKNALDFDWTFLFILFIVIGGGLFVLLFLLPMLGVF